MNLRGTPKFATTVVLGSPALTRLGARRAAPALVALCYHDLCEDGDFSSWLRVPVSVFGRHLTALSRLGRFVTPADLAEPSRLAADGLNLILTFDDGYVNVLRLALPILAQRRIPATVFVSTRPMIGQEPFWPDLLITPIQALRLPELDLRQFGLGLHRFHSSEDARRWDDVQRLLTRAKAGGSIGRLQMVAVLDHMRERYAGVLAVHLPRLRAMTGGELRELAHSPWLTVGAHGHDHDILTALDDEALDFNLRESRRILRQLTGHSVDDMAYPNGDTDDRVERRVAAAGFTRAWTTRPGLIRPGWNPLRLPRLFVGAFDTPAALRRQLNRVLWTGVWRRRGAEDRLGHSSLHDR
jgi:peptidoglycan/xylan/chitin deacetylase (PgdA/CDA1 family)